MLRSASLLLLVSAALSVVACSATKGDDADSQSANATGGDRGANDSLVYLFSAGDDLPVCVGSIIADKAIVVSQACVRDDLQVGLAHRGDSPMFWNKVKVTKVHVPATGPADIAVLEVEKKLGSTTSFVTRPTLRDGYTVFARQSVKEGLFGNGAGGRTQIAGSFPWMTDTQITLTPKAGAKLCLRDLGAMVCSSTQAPILGIGEHEECGLAGIVVAKPASGDLDENDCSGDAWKVAPLGLYRDFLEPFAPTLFAPEAGGEFPEGLWGHDSAGDVTSCELVTSRLDSAKPQTKQLVHAKASFAGMANRAEATAQFGLAKKLTPDAVTWVPARRTTDVKAAAFDDSFTAGIGAALAGEYIVSVRVSANGGETWKRCDDASKPLVLEVGAGEETTTPVTPDAGTPPARTDAGAPPVTPDAGSEDGKDGEGEVDEAPVPAADHDDGARADEPSSKSKKDTSDKSAGTAESGASPTSNDPVVPAAETAPDAGCSTAPGSSRSSGGLPAVGLLLGLAVLARRRK